MKTLVVTSPFRSVLSAIALGAVLFAQQVEEHKRPEQGDAMPDITVVDAASGHRLSVLGALATPPLDAPLVIAFVHQDKDLCVRFVKELAKEIDGLGESRERCAIHVVFCGEQADGATVAAARELPAPFRVQRDTDRSAYKTMGLIAFPTVYVVDRRTRTIETLRRGYKISLAQEVSGTLAVALGLMSAEDFARVMSPAAEVPAAVKRHRARLRQAHQLLHGDKPESAMQMFEAMLQEDPSDPDARAGRAIAAGRLGRPNAHELLVAAHEDHPEAAPVALALAAWLTEHDRLDEAEPLIRGALDHDPAPAWFALGRLHERRGQWMQAAIAYREAATRLMH
ncbi:MAG: tetratricopeptide repeat protein [Planctomycetes bacterium]|nr:tetratricopeptide repeat protein [Planctomycetota bacterium]